MIVRYCWGVCVHHGTELHHPGDCDTQFVTVTVTVLHTLYNVKWFHLKTYTIGERFIRVYCGCTCDPSSSDDAVAGTFWQGRNTRNPRYLASTLRLNITSDNSLVFSNSVLAFNYNKIHKCNNILFKLTFDISLNNCCFSS